jgi:hypothetical protein
VLVAKLPSAIAIVRQARIGAVDTEAADAPFEAVTADPVIALEVEATFRGATNGRLTADRSGAEAWIPRKHTAHERIAKLLPVAEKRVFAL